MEDEKLSETMSTLESVTEKAEPQPQKPKTAEDSKRSSAVAVDSSESGHAEGESRKAAAMSDLSPKDTHAGDKSVPSQETVPTSEHTAEETIPEVPDTQKDAVQTTVTVSEETGEEEKEQIRMNELTESCGEEKKRADDQTDQQVKKKEEMKPELSVDESTVPVEISEPQNSLQEETIPEQGTVCLDDPGKSKYLAEAEEEMKKKEDLQLENEGEETDVDMPPEEEKKEEEKKEEMDKKKLQQDTEEDQPKTKLDAKESIQMENEPEPVTSTVVEDIPAEKEKMLNENKTSEDVAPVIIINGDKDEVDHMSKKSSETNHVQSVSPEAGTEDDVDQHRAIAIKRDIEKDSDSGSSSAADTNSIDMNLSISSFLSRSKEGSISVQVRLLTKCTCRLLMLYEIAHVYEVVRTQDSKYQKKTLKKTRKFMVDGVEVSVTTSKIVTDNDTKNEELRFLR